MTEVILAFESLSALICGFHDWNHWNSKNVVLSILLNILPWCEIKFELPFVIVGSGRVGSMDWCMLYNNLSVINFD